MRSLFFLLLILVVVACQTDREQTGFQATPIDGEISNADLIRNPIQPDGNRDTINVAKMAFDEFSYNFGTVKAGELINRDFSFVNTGKVPLLITDARSTCGCTVADWPKDAVQPGERGNISVVFDTKNKKGNQNKAITITANTFPAATKLRVLGTVVE